MGEVSGGYVYLQSRGELHRPRTLNTAIQALRQGVIPPEGIVLLMNSLGPLGESASDFAAFDRLLSRPTLDLRTAQFLMSVFLRMVHHPDTETALYAAESLNFLEVRYGADSSQARRRLLESPGEASVLRLVLRAEYRLMVLNRDRRALGRHHAGEILRLLAVHRPWYRLRLSDTLMLVAALLTLGGTARASRLLERARKQQRNHPRLDKVRAELAFREGRADRVAELLRDLEAAPSSPKSRSQARFWLESGNQRGGT